MKPDVESSATRRLVRAEAQAALAATSWGPDAAAEVRGELALARACLSSGLTPERRFAASVALERRAIAAEERLVARMPGRRLLRRLSQ